MSISGRNLEAMLPRVVVVVSGARTSDDVRCMCRILSVGCGKAVGDKLCMPGDSYRCGMHFAVDKSEI